MASVGNMSGGIYVAHASVPGCAAPMWCRYLHGQGCTRHRRRHRYEYPANTAVRGVQLQLFVTCVASLVVGPVNRNHRPLAASFATSTFLRRQPASLAKRLHDKVTQVAKLAASGLW